jgi:hypothetical protein
MWASVSVGKLRADRKFKRSVIDAMPDSANVDVLEMCRIYIEKIGEIHASVRKHTLLTLFRPPRTYCAEPSSVTTARPGRATSELHSADQGQAKLLRLLKIFL